MQWFMPIHQPSILIIQFGFDSCFFRSNSSFLFFHHWPKVSDFQKMIYIFHFQVIPREKMLWIDFYDESLAERLVCVECNMFGQCMNIKAIERSIDAMDNNKLLRWLPKLFNANTVMPSTVYNIHVLRFNSTDCFPQYSILCRILFGSLGLYSSSPSCCFSFEKAIA